MSQPIEVKLFAAASINPGLTALLGTAPFRWYSTQLTPASAWPAITVEPISGPTLYSLGGRNPMTKLRVSFKIWEGYTPDTTNSVLDALRAFMDGFDAAGTGNSNNQIANQLNGLYAETQPGVYQKIIDYYIWNNDKQ